MNNSEKKIAIMQPYVFPYLGYFQLINAVDEFVFYDDVSFIKQGWINRNRILQNGKELLFTIPLKKQSSNNLIKETLIHEMLYKKWQINFQKSLYQSYNKAPHFEVVFDIIKDILNDAVNISNLAIKSIRSCSNYIGLKPQYSVSSIDCSGSFSLRRGDRLIEICKQKNCKTYINPIGGKDLYAKEKFKKETIDLLFFKPDLSAYFQYNKHKFISGLSIIDVMMFNSPDEIRDMLTKYTLV